MLKLGPLWCGSHTNSGSIPENSYRQSHTKWPHDRSASGLGDKGAGAVFYVRRRSCFLGAPAPALPSAVAQWSRSGTKQALNSHMKFARDNIIDLTTKEF